MTTTTTLCEDVYSFFDNNRALSICTAGVAVGVYAVGNLFGRIVTWIMECCQTSSRIESVAKEAIGEQAPLPKKKRREVEVKTPPSPNTTLTKNLATLECLQRCIFKDTPLPPRMIGEEHIGACLYAKLFDESGRGDIEIALPSPEGRIVREDFVPAETTRFILIPMSVNSNMHNTILIIDREKKLYAYFDSYNQDARISTHNRNLLSEQGLIDITYQIDIEAKHLHQRDGWSCGYFTLENACLYLDIGERQEGVSGDKLKEKYAPYFTMFASKHGVERTSHTDNRVNRRQKTRLRDALDRLICAKIPGYQNLEPLYGKLVEEVFTGSGTRGNPLSDFAARYLSEHESDALACQILSQFDRTNTPLWKIMRAEVEFMKKGESGVGAIKEGEGPKHKKAQIDAIKNVISTLLTATLN